jgi:hypothetical protein
MLPLLVVPLGEVVLGEVVLGEVVLGEVALGEVVLGDVELAGPPAGVPGPWVCVLSTLLVPPPVPELPPACANASPVAIASAADAAISVSFFMG